MAGYTKLFGSILDSTVWELPHASRIVWFALMAMADRYGEVQASVPGLTRRARVTREECETALASFLSPDPDSRTKDADGRRIEEIDGGWRLINHRKYTQILSEEDRRERAAERQRRHRANTPVTDGHASSRPVTDDNASHDTQTQTHTQTDPGKPQQRAGDLWPAWKWFNRFRSLWPEAHGKIAYGTGEDDANATGALEDVLNSLPGEDRLAAQGHADQLISGYFAISKARPAGHPWKWFVQRFNELRMPPNAKASAPARSDPNCSGWHAGGKNTGRKNPRGRQDACPECKSIDLREWTSETRAGEPTTVGALAAQGGRT